SSSRRRSRRSQRAAILARPAAAAPEREATARRRRGRAPRVPSFGRSAAGQCRECRVWASCSWAPSYKLGRRLYPPDGALSLRAFDRRARGGPGRRRRRRGARVPPMENTRQPASPTRRMPPEWAPHAATWLSWPHNRDTWPGVFDGVEPAMAQAAAALAETELVYINVLDAEHEAHVKRLLDPLAPPERIRYFRIPTNDAWVRDHGPIF